MDISASNDMCGNLQTDAPMLSRVTQILNFNLFDRTDCPSTEVNVNVNVNVLCFIVIQMPS